MSNETVYRVVTDRMVRLLESGVVPWRATWSEGAPSTLGQHRNAVSGHVYRGVNALMTFAVALTNGYEQPLWLTFKQALALGGNVRKGEKGTPIIYASHFTTSERDDATGAEVERSVPFMKYSHVFNVSQCEGLAIGKAVVFEPVRFAFSAIERCEDVVASMPNPPRVEHSATCETPYYAPSRDLVVMPERERFETPEFYYTALFHELTHSTAHASRLDRKGTGCRGSYGREELIAEFGAAFLCAVAGIEQATERDSAAYLANWLGALRADSRMLISAAAHAQKAADYILGIAATDVARKAA